MNRILLLGAAVAAATVAVGPVHAAPAPADAGRVAATHIVFHLNNGRSLDFDLRAGALSGGDTLRVLVQRCNSDGCDASTEAFQSALRAGDLNIDPNTATAELRTTIAGHALHIRWAPDGSNAAEVGGVEGQGGSLSTSGSGYTGSPATATIELDDRNCNGAGAVGDGAFIDTAAATGSPSDAPLADLHVPATAPLTCG